MKTSNVNTNFKPPHLNRLGLYSDIFIFNVKVYLNRFCFWCDVNQQVVEQEACMAGGPLKDARTRSNNLDPQF